MSDYKLTFKLKQHTPIIHFQHDQYGATLRASELKPKLDKFILMKMGEDEDNSLTGEEAKYNKGYEVAKVKKWLVGKGEHPALDYKVKIIDNDINPIRGTVAVMPSTRENWRLSNDLTFYLMTNNSALKTKIEEEVDLFFARTNFGKRQSKGFGCFYPDTLSEDNFREKLNANSNIIFKYDGNLRNEIQNDTYFYNNIISRNWGRLKSGKNFGGYEKSRMFEYLCAKNLRWDKRWIKKELKNLITSGTLPEDLEYTRNPIDCGPINDWEDRSHNEYRFGRALLGLAEHYEFRAQNNYLYQVKIKNDDIERFKSPVTFKVYKRHIYAIVEDINLEIFNKTFSFEVFKKQNNITVGIPIRVTGLLNTPTSIEFNLEDFLNNYFNTVGFIRV